MQLASTIEHLMKSGNLSCPFFKQCQVQKRLFSWKTQYHWAVYFKTESEETILWNKWIL